MNKYFENPNNYFEMPKTDSFMTQDTSIREEISKVAEKLIDPRYNTRKPSLKILGHVKK